jgi:hypothetical protein
VSPSPLLTGAWFSAEEGREGGQGGVGGLACVWMVGCVLDDLLSLMVLEICWD